MRKFLTILFDKYKKTNNWKEVNKTHENLFIIGAESILLRNGLLLEKYFESKNEHEHNLLNEDQQKQLIRDFSGWCVSNPEL